MVYHAQMWLHIWTLAHVSLDQGSCLASKSPDGCRPDNALNRLGSPPGVGGVVVDGVYTVLLNVYLPHTLSLYWKLKLSLKL